MGDRFTYTLGTNPVVPKPVVPNPVPNPVLTTSALPAAEQGQAYAILVAASSGTPPYTFTATGLPPGLTLSAGGCWPARPSPGQVPTRRP